MCARGATTQPATVPLRPYLAWQATVELQINGVTGTFLFDTGEGVTAISPAFAAKIGCQPWGRVTGFRMSGERIDAPHCDGLRTTAQGVPLAASTVMVLDIMKLMGDDVPPIDGAVGLDAFAGQTITIVPRRAIILETAASLRKRVDAARELPIRQVRDAEGLALAVDGAVRTPKGLAWMELDTGNGGSFVVGDHVAPLLGLAVDQKAAVQGRFDLANGIAVEGPVRTRDLIMDGDIGARFLNSWTLTLDLARGRAWLAAAGK